MLLIEIIVTMIAIAVSLFLALRWLSVSAEAQAGNAVPEDIALLFDGAVLHHLSDAATYWFPLEPGEHKWSDVRYLAQEHFAQFPDAPPARSAYFPADIPSDGGGFSSAQIIRMGKKTLVKFEMGGAPIPQVACLNAVNRGEVASHTAPYPIWQVNKAGRVVWSNAAFEALGSQAGNPLLQIDMEHCGDGLAKRCAVRLEEAQSDQWFDITRVRHGEIAIFHCHDANDLVRAEEAQSKFVQTLTKTFAHLSIGLAIFDRNKQLALFNPALVDLSALNIEFLSARPTMLAFFDRLREARRMPEPKNYRNWRQQIGALIAAASDGHYQESWTLVSGQTLRVTGRPHPDGATAFLIEDISATVSMTRNFRAELELGQLVFDRVAEALAVFSPSGVLLMSNNAYRALWSVNPDDCFADMTLRDSLALWRREMRTALDWPVIEARLLSPPARDPFKFGMTHKSGGDFLCEAQVVPSGEIMITFKPLPAAHPLPALLQLPA
ncbi:MAG: PAS-domain containing protein [Sulfitobacter sp.]